MGISGTATGAGRTSEGRRLVTAFGSLGRGRFRCCKTGMFRVGLHSGDLRIELHRVSTHINGAIKAAIR